MISLTDRDRAVLLAALFKVPVLPEAVLSCLWPATDSGRENMARRLYQLCDARLLARHQAQAQLAAEVECFYLWTPGRQEPNFGALAWELSGRWEALKPVAVTFYTATEAAANHYGRTIANPLRSATSLAHNFGLAAVYFHFFRHHRLLADAWVAEEVVASTRGHGEKVVDAVIVNSASMPALAVEFAGASYAASNGERLREIHADCALRKLAYEMWTVARGDKP